MSVKITMLGAPQLQAKLKLLNDAMQKKIVKKVLKSVAKDVLLPAVDRNVPIDTGRLAASLKVKVFSKRNLFGAKVVTGTREELGIGPEEKGYYPMAVETGTSKQAAQPYLRPALHGNKDLIFEYTRNGLGSALESEAKK